MSPREDHMEAVFYACDGAWAGQVSAGQLADHLATRLTDLQPRWLLGALREALCSDGEEQQLDLPTFRQLLLSWLQRNAAHILPNSSPPPDTSPLLHQSSSPTPDTRPVQPSPPLDASLVSPLSDALPHQQTTPSTPSPLPPGLHQPQASTHGDRAFHFLGPLCAEDHLEEWLRYSTYPGPPPPPPPPPPPARSSRVLGASFEHHLSDPSRRSTLLPRVGGWGAASHSPLFTPLDDMSRPPSPITPRRSLVNGADPPPPPRPSLYPEDDGGPRSLDGSRGRCHHHLHNDLQRSFNYTFGSIEDEGGVTEPDPLELQQEVLELSHTNKRLTGENQELTTYLTAAEDANASLREQCRGLHHALLGVQQQLEAARALEAEVEAARRQMEEGKEERGGLVTRLSHLERDNASLTSRLHLLAEQLSVAQEEVEGHTQREEEAVKRHREEVTRLSTQLAYWKAQAEVQSLTAYRLQETLEDVQKLVKVLREEKRSLEEQLSHIKEELAVATRSDCDMSSMEGPEDGIAYDSPSPEKTSEGLERGGGARVAALSSALTPSSVISTNTAAPTPTNMTQPSPAVDTPLSIHSEIQTMGEDSAFLPFCEKEEGRNSEERRSDSPSEAGGSTLASVRASMLQWWKEWAEQGIPILRAMVRYDTATLHNHIATHHKELVRLEREMQEIQQVVQPLSAAPGWMPLEASLKEWSLGSTQDSALPSSQATTPTLPRRRSRTPGSIVSQLISKFESSSQSSSPVCSEAGEKPGSVEQLSSLSQMLQRAKWEQRTSDDCGRSESTNSEDGRSVDHHSRRSFEENVRLHEYCLRGLLKDAERRDILTTDICNSHGPESVSEVGGPCGEKGVIEEALGSDQSGEGEDCLLLEYGLEQDVEQEEETSADIKTPPSTTAQRLQNGEQKEEEEEEGVKKGVTVVVVEDALEPEKDPYMEMSHLMKLMNEVAEQRAIIVDLRRQVSSVEDEEERLVATLQRVHRLVLQASTEAFRWTEGVRREWLAVVVPRVAGVGEDGDGADSITPATPTHPLDEVPLTTSFSREEIEALISARRNPPACEARPKGEDDRQGHVVSPETLAAELERELTALRVHVYRSHALLHHYQSSSIQYGSRAEASTPAITLPPIQHALGVEVGVECDLCGPTCVPRPCDSTATQTPASPLSTTPECEETATTTTTPSATTTTTPSTTTTTTTASSTRRAEEEEEEEEEEDSRSLTKHKQQQQRVKWKEEEEEEEEELKEEEEEEALDEEVSSQEEHHLLLAVVGGAKDPQQQQQQQQPQQQHPPGPRQVGFLHLPEHRQLRQVEVVPPAHRTLRQLGVGKEEEELQETAPDVEEGVDIIPMASEHSLYSPKPAYDHLDHYRSGVAARAAGEEKHRRSGLSSITPQVSSTGESRENEEESTLVPSRPRSRPQMEVTPLSPPPSLDNVEEEDMEEGQEEEEPALPSTPESSSSMTSGDMFSHAPRAPPRLPRRMSMSALELPDKAPPLQSLPEADSSSAPTPGEEPVAQQETSTTEKGHVFPSLHDVFLRTVGLLPNADPAFTPNENLSEQEIENKFTQLSLAFKTDRLTLRQRLDLQQRHRDTAEVNLEAEMKHLRNAVLALHADCTDSELVDAVTQVRRHLDVLAASSTRLVSTSEVWGAVQQEWRVSRALEVLFLHADNVKRKYEREHGELEELRRLMNEYQIELPGSNAMGGGSGNQLSSDSPSTSRRLRALSLAVCSNKAASSQETRRVSLASSSKNSGGFAGSARSRGRRASLMPDLKPFREHLAAVAAAAVAASKDSSSSSSSSNGNDLSASKDRGEDVSKGVVPPTGRWNCSITEEASESGEEEGSSTQDVNSATIMTAISNTTLSSSPSSSSFTNVDVSLGHLPADLLGLDPNPDDSDERASDDPSQSDLSQGSSGDYRESPPASFWTRSRPQHWLVVALKEVLGWAKGGQWPYSQQQTVQGARYAFTSLLLVLAALFLLVTLSSGDVKTPQPRHPGWTTVHHILHPFVTLRYLALPPT